jgi:hypothetical protein
LIQVLANGIFFNFIPEFQKMSFLSLVFKR